MSTSADLETLKEVQEWLNDDSFTIREKLEGIASMLFIELSEEKQMDLFYEMGDDFAIYLKFVDCIDFDGYDGDCIREMHELITDKFIGMKTMASKKMKKQHKFLNSIMR